MAKSKKAIEPAPAGPAALAAGFWPLAVFLLTLAAFAPVLSNGFVNWDDTGFLLNNHRYRGLGWEELRWMFTSSHMGIYQPLSWLSYALDYKLWGMNPLGYHLTSLLLHALGAVVFFRVVLRLLEAAGSASTGPGAGIPMATGLAALFFSAHPLRVESVAWASERRDVLSGLFYLIAVELYLRRRLYASWLAFLFSLLSKGMGITLPLALLILDAYPLGRLRSDWRGCLREKLPFFALSLVFGVVGIVGESRHATMPGFSEMGVSARLAQAAYGAMFYLWKTLWPAGLMPAYQAPPGMSLLAPPFLLCALGVAAITALAARSRISRPWWLAAWAFYLLTLAPVSGLVKFGAQLAADRYSYLPCLSWAVLAAGGARALAAAYGLGLARLLGLALFGTLMGLTWRQTGVWRDSEALWGHVLSLDPGLAVGHSQLGIHLAESGRLAQAISSYERALALDPAQWNTRHALASALAEQGRYEAAEAQDKRILEAKPDYVAARVHLGVIAMRRGKTEEAQGHYLEALRLAPANADAAANLAAALYSQGRLEESMSWARRALASDPRHAPAHVNLGVVLARQGRLNEAVALFQRALVLDPRSSDARHNLGLALRLQKKP